MTTQHTHTPTSTLSPDRLDLPPPLALELSDMGRPVGWIEGDVVGFRGFADEHEAAHAAWVAHRTLARRIARTTGGRPIPIGTERLRIARQDGAELVMAGGLPIATLVRPGATSPSGPDSFGFAIRIPSPTYEARVRGMAYLVYRTLRKSGIRWTMWSRDGRNAARAEPERRRQAATSRDARRRASDRRQARARTTNAALAAPGRARRDLEWGLGLVGLALLALASVMPTAAVPLTAAVGVGALVLAGVHELPLRWWARRARRAPSTPAPRNGQAVEGGADRAGWSIIVASAATASLAALLLALAASGRVAVVLGSLGLLGLMGIRVLAARTGWLPSRPIRVRRTVAGAPPGGLAEPPTGRDGRVDDGRVLHAVGAASPISDGVADDETWRAAATRSSHTAVDEREPAVTS
jgi:hypothetical protein